MSKKSPSNESLEKRIRELENENEILSDFAGLSSEWFWEQDASFRFVRFWGMLMEKLQRDQSLFIGKRRWEMPIQGISDEALQAHIDCYENHQPFRDFEYEVAGDNGEIQHYSISGKPVYDREGNFSGYRGIGRNLTALHNAQKAVAESQEQLLQILQGSPVATFVIDGNHKVTHWNKACEILTGVSAEEAIGKSNSWRGFYEESRPTMADLVVDEAPVEDIKAYYEYHFAVSNLVQGAYEAEDLFPNIGPSGHWLHFSASPLKDADGTIIGAIETIEDVTDRVKAEHAEKRHYTQLKQAHAELKATLQQLVEAKKLASLGRLVAGVAHELNSPLGNISMGVSTAESHLIDLQQDFAANKLSHSGLKTYLDSAEKSLVLIEHNLKRSINLITCFQELSNDSKAKTLGACSLFKIIQSVFLTYQHKNIATGVLFRNEVPTDFLLNSNEEALEQIILSLTENVLTHAELDDEGEIIVSLKEHAESVDLCFCDNGTGMDDNTKEHAFDPFYSSAMGYGSSGLGLYRVYNLVTVVLGGRITLQDRDPGLQVTIALPKRSL